MFGVNTSQHLRVVESSEPFPHELYLPKPMGNYPLICITPILGRFVLFDDLFFERRFAKFFATHGLASVLIDRPIFEFDPSQGLEQIHEYLESSLDRNTQVLNTVLRFDDISQGEIGSFGMSFGAVVNCIWAQSEPRIKVHAFALAGGNLPEIFVTSRDSLMRSYHDSALEKAGWDSQRLLGHLREVFRRDPLDAAHSLKREDVLMVLAVFDRVIRFRYGWALRCALKGPETVFLPLGHYLSMLTVPILQWKVLSFFKKRFAARAGGTGS